MAKFLVLFLSFLSLAPQVQAAGCNCQTACAQQAITSITAICSREDSIRCGGVIETKIMSTRREAQNTQAQRFQSALTNQRAEIMRLYSGSINDEQYTRLSILAFGILGNESTYYQGWRYLKRLLPERAIHYARCVKRGCSEDPVSSGPTQIKHIPTRIAKHFGVTPGSLVSNPEHAAAATMGFLIELRSQIFALRRKYPVQLGGLNDYSMVNYLPYFYQGKGRRILQGEPPNEGDNIYLARLNFQFSTMSVQQLNCSPTSSPTIATGGRQ